MSSLYEGDVFMSEKLAEVFEQYEVDILGTRKGRGAVILSTDKGMMILEPFRGNMVRLEQEYVLKQILEKNGFFCMDMIVPNREGILFSCDRYRQPFVMKRHFDGNECDMHCPADMVRSIKLLANFHSYGKLAAAEFDPAWKKYRKEKEEKRISEIRQAVENGGELEWISRVYDIRENILIEMLENTGSSEVQQDEKEENEVAFENDKEIADTFVRHNRELKKIYRYIGKVKKKNAFEDLFLQVYGEYAKQGEYCVEQLAGKGRETLKMVGEKHFGICHGSFNQHNILLFEKGRTVEVDGAGENVLDKDGAIVHFERFSKGNQLNDLYQFARKAMEKNHFNIELLRELLYAYSEEIPLSKEDYHYIYILFSYPEKFWKIANGYYNSNKAFLSPKYVEKLQNVILQEAEKQEMLENFGTLQVSLD